MTKAIYSILYPHLCNIKNPYKTKQYRLKDEILSNIEQKESRNKKNNLLFMLKLASHILFEHWLRNVNH